VGHGEILAAIKAHDAKRARQAMAEHIDKSRDRILNVFFRGELSSNSYAVAWLGTSAGESNEVDYGIKVK
jgi:hypothetical protein